jgi:hypothetical protein
MKVDFSLKTTYTPKFNDNDKLPKKTRMTVDLEALESLDLISLADAFQRAGLGEAVDTAGIEHEQAKALLEAVGDLLPKYCVIHNLHSNDGEIGTEVVVKYPPFQDLALEILMALAGVSQPTEDDVKN